jgi:uncharacterized membrane protein
MENLSGDREERAMRSMQAPAWMRNAVQQMEESPRLDRLAEAIGPFAGRAAAGRAGSVLRGEWLGHALHPLLTDLPLGCWMSANLLDLVGGKRSEVAARRLVGLGLLFVPATTASGLADWGSNDSERVGRVGAVHAAGNVAVALLYLSSWRSRRRGQHLRGVALGMAGGLVAVGTGYLGGHLSFVLGSGVEPRGGIDRGPWDDADAEAAGPLGLVDLVDDREAASLLEVPVDRVHVMVEEGLLSPVLHSATGPKFERTDVLAVRLIGG